MALSKTLENDFGTFSNAYHKIFRFEFRTAGRIPYLVEGEDGRMEPAKDANGAPIEVDDVSAEVQVLSYPDQTKADADARPLEAARFSVNPQEITSQIVIDAAAEVGAIDSADKAISLMKSILYRAIKSKPEFAGAQDI